MKLHIITPQHVIFEGEVDAVTVPGRDGEFQMLNNHAAIVSSLDKGTIKIKLHSKTVADFDNVSGKLEKVPGNELVYHFDVTGGVVEMNNNVVTILAN
ncbi:MAG: F0F1 ATP synthase subunit epsilon [Weeksellaceae bacterium]|nr:F0F1 ATP synthase subunit epsilon [Weeksellaceae bacterium]